MQRKGGGVIDAPHTRNRVGDARPASKRRGATPDQSSRLLHARGRGAVDAAHASDEEEKIRLGFPPHGTFAPEANRRVEVGHGKGHCQRVLGGAGHEGGGVLYETTLLQQQAAGVADAQQGRGGRVVIGGDVGHALVGEHRRDQDGIRPGIALENVADLQCEIEK